MKKAWPIAILAAAYLVVGCSSARLHRAQPVPGPQVMLVSSFHLANNNRDLINLPIEDVLVPRRQEEIQQLVANLARWRPTRIVIEWDRSDQAGLDLRYEQYLRGDLELSANERDQIALRLARHLGHSKVYAADWNENFPGERAAYDFLAWAERSGESERLKAFVAAGQSKLDRQAQIMREQSIIDWYYDLNQPEVRAQDHRQYFRIATFGTNAENPGAAWVGGWYARNLRIFNNIREALGSGERVLVLYGSGHVFLLDRFFQESGAAHLVDPRPYIRR